MRSNFRAHYYTSLGFQGAELKSSLELMLKDNVVETKKLHKICLSCALPPEYRAIIWKLLLGVLPVYREVWEFVHQQKTAQYEDIKHAALLIYRSVLPPSDAASDTIRSLQGRLDSPQAPTDHSDDSPSASPRAIPSPSSATAQLSKSEMADLLSVVYRVQTYLFDESSQTAQKQDYDAEELRRIAEVFCYVCGTQSEADAYWCYAAFLQCREQIYGHHATGIYHQINVLSRLVEKCVPDVWRHLLSLHITLDGFSYQWFRGYFTSCLPLHSLEKVWDRVMAVSHDFLACLGCAIIVHLKYKILDVSNPRELKRFLGGVHLPKVNVEQLIAKATELYSGDLQELQVKTKQLSPT